MPQQLGAKYLLASSVGLDYELARKCHYEVDIYGLNSILVAQDVTIPRYELEGGEVFHYNSRSKYPMRPNPGDMRVSFLDVISPNVVTAINTWFNSCYDPDTDTMGLVGPIKRQGNVMLYGPDETLLRTWSCYGMWPKNSPVPGEAYTYTDQGHSVIDMVFSVDWVTMNAPSVAS